MHLLILSRDLGLNKGSRATEPQGWPGCTVQLGGQWLFPTLVTGHSV